MHLHDQALLGKTNDTSSAFTARSPETTLSSASDYALCASFASHGATTAMHHGGVCGDAVLHTWKNQVTYGYENTDKLFLTISAIGSLSALLGNLIPVFI